MRDRQLGQALSALALVTFAIIGGCNTPGSTVAGARVSRNPNGGNSCLRIRLDGKEAEQSTSQQAGAGETYWKINQQVRSYPKLSYAVTRPDKLGRITSVIAAIYQQAAAGYSPQPDFTVVPRYSTVDTQMKPDTQYDLGKPGGAFKALDAEGNEVTQIPLNAGMKFKLVLTIKGDHCETASVEFETK